MFFLPAVFALLGYLPSSVLADAPQPQAAANVGGEASAIREYFYVGGSYVPVGNEHLFANQMYVEKLKPSRSLQPFPLVFIHGNGQSGTVGYPLSTPRCFETFGNVVAFGIVLEVFGAETRSLLT